MVWFCRKLLTPGAGRVQAGSTRIKHQLMYDPGAPGLTAMVILNAGALRDPSRKKSRVCSTIAQNVCNLYPFVCSLKHFTYAKVCVLVGLYFWTSHSHMI